jgi:RsbT co-antagonist protein rsbRD N-terminal domain
VERLEKQLVDVIKDKKDEVALTWYREVRESNYVPTLNNVSEDEAMRIAGKVYDSLSMWLKDQSSVDVKQTFLEFGESLFRKGFRMEEAVQVIILLKRYLWLHLLQMGLMTTDINIYQTLELNNKVVLFYDRSIYFALVGYREARTSSAHAG